MNSSASRDPNVSSEWWLRSYHFGCYRGFAECVSECTRSAMDYISHTYLSASEMLLGCHLDHELEQRLQLLKISSTESEKH